MCKPESWQCSGSRRLMLLREIDRRDLEAGATHGVVKFWRHANHGANHGAKGSTAPESVIPRLTNLWRKREVNPTAIRPSGSDLLRYAWLRVLWCGIGSSLHPSSTPSQPHVLPSVAQQDRVLFFTSSIFQKIIGSRFRSTHADFPQGGMQVSSFEKLTCPDWPRAGS